MLGDGKQEKPYLHVLEVVDAMICVRDRALEKLNCYHIGSAGSVTTVRYIAEAVLKAAAPHASIRYTGGAKGWPGDVPRFNYSIDKIRRLGWFPKASSNEAVDRAVGELTAV